MIDGLVVNYKFKLLRSKGLNSGKFFMKRGNGSKGLPSQLYPKEGHLTFSFLKQGHSFFFA